MFINSILSAMEREIVTDLPPRGTHPPIPDWRSFKVADCPQLVQVEKELAAYGLKDPWLRNEAWRYDPKTYPGTDFQRLMKFHFRGFKWGLLLAVTHASIKYMLSKEEDHGHGEDEHGH